MLIMIYLILMMFLKPILILVIYVMIIQHLMIHLYLKITQNVKNLVMGNKFIG